MRYCAFLSYSHADAGWARWLLRRLEGYRVPSRLVGTPGRDGPIPARLGTVFRDRDELPTAGDLSQTIREALGESRALVLLCSPAAARSQWVNAEIETFRSARPGAPILSFIVAGDPHSSDPDLDCFPPALLQPGPDGQRHEPLAADARAEGDGRERAFLKLVAGLLGVGYDTLVQREAQRRHRRMLAITMASLVGMAITLTLAATAYVARNDAQRRQAQAEDIVGFMLGDLREKLTTVGRLDLMRTVDDKATEYFATLDPRDLSDRALEEQARSLTGIGQVRLEEGNHEEAQAAFQEALERSQALLERDPDNGQRLFDLSQAEYWIGFVAYQQGRYDTAQTWLTRYRDSAIRLAAMDPDNFDWQREVVYGHHNLAVLEEKRGRYDDAERTMRKELALYRKWTALHPEDTALRFEAANVVSWLGNLMFKRGRLEEAAEFYAEEVAAYASNAHAEPDDVKWKRGQVSSHILLAEASAHLGRLDVARGSIGTATRLAEALTTGDPSNNDWKTSLGISRWWQARLAERGDPAAAAGVAEQAISLLSSAHQAEPKSEQILTWLIRSHQLRAQFALDADDPETAQEHLSAARALVEPAWAAERNELRREALAWNHLLEGDAARERGDPQTARANWIAARDLLLDGPREVPFSRLDPLVRALAALDEMDQATRLVRRLESSGYVPLDPFPFPLLVAAR